jgi:hypothetical protein
LKHWFNNNRELIIISFAICLVFLLSYFFERSLESYYSFIVLYLSLFIFSLTLPDWKLLRTIILFFRLPMIIFLLISPLTKAGLLIYIAFIFSFGIIAIVLKYCTKYFFSPDIDFSSKLYLLLTFGSIIMTVVGEKIIIWLNRAINYNKSSQRVSAQLKLTFGIFNNSRSKFLIYLSFFVYLIFYSLSNLNGISLFEIKNMHTAIFYSFISYTAFERVYSNLDLMKINLTSFIDDFKEVLSSKPHDED